MRDYPTDHKVEQWEGSVTVFHWSLEGAEIETNILINTNKYVPNNVITFIVRLYL